MLQLYSLGLTEALGVERVAWDLSDFLGARHDAAFVGIAMDESENNSARFHAIQPRKMMPLASAFRSCPRALELIQPDVTLTLGAVCPPGDVYWVQSVHRAYLDRSPGPSVSGHQAPYWTQSPHAAASSDSAMEQKYFRGVSPFAILCTSDQEISDLIHYYDVAATRCKVMPNGFDPSIFNPERRKAERGAARAQLGIAPGDVSLLFVRE